MDNFKMVMVISLLIICTISDIKYRTISLRILGIFVMIAVIDLWQTDKKLIIDSITGIGVGVGTYFIYKVTKGGIGLGDALLLCVTGLYLGFSQNIQLFLGGLFCSCFFSIILLVCRKANKKKTLPFVPFLLVYFLWMITV